MNERMGEQGGMTGSRPVSADTAIRWGAAGAVLVVAAVAAYISYRHAYELATGHGETRSTAAGWPLTVDGLIFAASMVLLQSARRGIKGWASLWLAYVMLAAGIAATVAANVAHGMDHGRIGAAVAAWPALALVGSYELLMWIVRTSPQAADAEPESAIICQCGEGGVQVDEKPLTLPEVLARAFESGTSQRQLADELGWSRDRLRATIRQARPPAEKVAEIHPELDQETA